MAYKNILVAVDITAEAEEVIKAARDIAPEKTSTISAVTVIRPSADFYVKSMLSSSFWARMVGMV